jgi:small basic protein (TIGR04137 family)
MSIHSSLRVRGGMAGSRNVWTRVERLVALKRDGRWEEGKSVLHLPKVRTRFKVKSKKEAKAAAPEAAAPEAAAAPAKEAGKGKPS